MFCKTKEEKRLFFPEITFKAFLEIIRVWNKTDNLLELVVKHEFIPEELNYRNLQKLAKNSWLNDAVSLNEFSLFSVPLKGNQWLYKAFEERCFPELGEEN